MKNKEHFEIRSMEFLLKSWSGEQNFYINLRGGGENSIIYERMSSIPSPQVLNFIKGHYASGHSVKSSF